MNAATGHDLEWPGELENEMKRASWVVVVATLSGCGPAWSGKVSGYPLQERDAVFTTLMSGSIVVGAVVVVGDHPDLCAALGEPRAPPNSTMAVFNLKRAADGKRLSPDVGDYVVSSELSSGATTSAVFIRTDANGTNSIPALNAKASSGALKVLDYQTTGNPRLVATFDGRFGNDPVTANINARWCPIDDKNLGKGFLSRVSEVSLTTGCRALSRCTGDPRPTEPEIASCEAARAPSATCASDLIALTDCYGLNQTCRLDNTTDYSLLGTACRAQIDAFHACDSPPARPKTETQSGTSSVGEQTTFGPYKVVASTPLRVQVSGTGDVDLYVRFDYQPSTASYDCRSESSGASELCNLIVPASANNAYFLIRGWGASTYSATINWVGY